MAKKKRRNLLCRLFGHQPPVYAEKGWWSPGQEYAHIASTEIDGLNVRHATIEGKCARCGEQFRICRIHLPSPKIDTVSN